MKRAYVFVGSIVLAALGVVQLLMPQILSYPSSATFARWNAIVAGAIVIVLGVWSAVVRPAPERLRTTLVSGAPTLGVIALAVYLLVSCFALLYTRIGRINTFWEMALAMAILVVAISVEHSRLSHMTFSARETAVMAEQVHA
jgi:hypothetical protein